MEFISEAALQYSEDHSTPPAALLKTIFSETNASHPHAHMMSSTVQAQFLALICRMVKPRRVLEIGTFTGFATLSMASAIDDDALLHSIELREDDAATAAASFSKSPAGAKIKLHRGNAMHIIVQFQEEWDLVFIDADKTGYIDYYELTLPRLRQGGFIVADNVLFHGQVFDDNPPGKNARAIHEFNRHVAADPRTEQVLLTVRDGLSIIRKL